MYSWRSDVFLRYKGVQPSRGGSLGGVGIVIYLTVGNEPPHFTQSFVGKLGNVCQGGGRMGFLEYDFLVTFIN